jgi:hypothetical protein
MGSSNEQVVDEHVAAMLQRVRRLGNAVLRGLMEVVANSELQVDFQHPLPSQNVG